MSKKMTGHRMMLVPADVTTPMRVVEFEDGDWRAMTSAIGAQYIERVKVGPCASLAVDEEGLLDQSKKVNARASLLYGSHLHGAPIMGDALFGVEGETPEGVDWLAPSPEELRQAWDAACEDALSRRAAHGTV